MAIASEVQSLNDIQYKSKIKLFLIILLVIFLFIFSFMNFYPIGDKVKTIIKSSFKAPGCHPDFEKIQMEWFLPKIVISELTIPAACLQREGEALKLTHLTINYHLLNFSPFGLPFRIDTDFAGRPLSVYYVLGFGKQMIRLKDQNINLAGLEKLLGENVKLGGNLTLDLNLSMSKNKITDLSIKSQSKDLNIPSQNIEGLTTPPLKINDFYLEASSETHPRLRINKLILGDPESPIKANLKGKIDLIEGNTSMSPIDLAGEVAFTENFRQALPLVDMMFQSFNQKDGFYQIKLGGTLGSPSPLAP